VEVRSSDYACVERRPQIGAADVSEQRRGCSDRPIGE